MASLTTDSLRFRILIAGALYFISLYNVVQSRKLLLIGDSVDRLTVTAWCNRHGTHKISANWGDASMKYGRKSKQPTSVCNNTRGDSIASVHIFGSSNGPYLWVDNDKFTGTAQRIRHALQLYSTQFGHVDQIIFNAVLWDLRPQFVIGENDTDSKSAVPYLKTLKTMESDVNSRLDELLEVVGSKVDVGVRNTPYSPGYEEKGLGPLYRDYNQMMRKIARNRNITFYDYDFDLWSSVKYDYRKHKDVFADISHPKPSYNRAAAEKMLGQRYSRFYQNNMVVKDNSNCSFSLNMTSSSSFSFLLNNCPNLSISLIQVVDDEKINDGVNDPYDITSYGYYLTKKYDIESLYFSNIVNGTRCIWNNVSEQFLLKHSIGSADIYRIPMNVLSSMKLLGSASLLPHRISEESTVKRY